MTTRRVIALLTDFGLADPYVAAMKGVILSVTPRVSIVDITHEVRPQAVEQGAFLLEMALPYFPPGTVFVAVVDPGVGTARRPLALAGPGGLFVGPDNGLLSPALPEKTREAVVGETTAAVPLPSGYRAVVLADERFFRHPVSATFHGRDIFSPVAAHLATGVAIDELGPATDWLLALPPFRARRQEDGSLLGRVVHIDRFGNLVTDVRRADIPGQRLTVEVAGRRIPGLARTYAEARGLCAIIGSAGYLEIALPNGSAQRELGVEIGARAIVRPL